MKSLLILCLLLVFFSCRDGKEMKLSDTEKDQTIDEGSEIKISSKKNVTDSVAKQMMDMWGMEGETFHDMMKTDSLEGEIMKLFSVDGLAQIIKESKLSEAEQKKILIRIKQFEEQKVANSGKDLQNDTKKMMDGYFKELETVLAASGSEQQLKELQAMMEKDNIKDKLDALSTDKVNPKMENLRKVLGTNGNSFIEDDLTSYSLYGNKEKREALQKLAFASKEEGMAILIDYYQMSEKEIELLKKMPIKQTIPSETLAQQLLDTGLPKEVVSHNTSGKASPKFKNLTEYFIQEQSGRAKDFIQKSKDARNKFYKENPGWHGEKSETGNTYIDSRHKFIYLPLGAISFADKVISHQLGNPEGSNKQGAIGEPDLSTERFDKASPKICNLGTRGVLTLEFTDNAITDVNGADLYIFEMGTIEPTNLEISKDGISWINVGKIDGGTALVDIEPFVKKGETYTYIRLTDLASYSELPGADVDAVAAIGGAIRLNLDSAVLFDTGKYQLKKSASGELKKLVDAIKAIPKAKIIVEGHTDNVGNPTSNKSLSENRAKEVSNYLKTELSSSYSFEIKGYGDRQPIAPNNTDENKQKNRRVEILVIPN